MHPQLVFFARDRAQGVARQVACNLQHIDVAFAVYIARNLALAEKRLVFNNPAFAGKRQGDVGAPRCDGLVVFVYGVLAKQALVGIAVGCPD